MLVRIRTRAGRLKREVFIARPLNRTVIKPLSAVYCDPLIAARVMTVGVPQKGVNSMSDPVSVKNAGLLTVILAVCLRTAYVPLDYSGCLSAHSLRAFRLVLAGERNRAPNAMERQLVQKSEDSVLQKGDEVGFGYCRRAQPLPW